MPVGQDVVASIARVSKLMHWKDVERMASGMSQVDDIRRLWSEGHDVSEIARVTGHDSEPDEYPRRGYSRVARRGQDADGTQKWACRRCGRAFTERAGGLQC